MTKLNVYILSFVRHVVNQTNKTCIKIICTASCFDNSLYSCLLGKPSLEGRVNHLYSTIYVHCTQVYELAIHDLVVDTQCSVPQLHLFDTT